MKSTRTYLYRLMMTSIIFSLSLFVQAQSPRIKAVLFGNNAIIKGHNVQLLVSGARGVIQWQKSLNSIDWTDIAGKTSDSLNYPVDTNLFFRVRMKEENCDVAFSDISAFMPMLLKEDAVVIDNGEITLTSDSADLANGIYNFEFSKDPEFQVGDVIVGTEGIGYIRVVSGVETHGHAVTLTTTQGTLEDVISEINIHDSLVISMKGSNPKFARVNGVEVPVRITHQASGVILKSGGDGIDLNNTVLIDENVDDAEVKATINSGSFEFSPIFNRDMKISQSHGMETFSMSAKGELKYSCELEVNCTKDFEYAPDPVTLLEVSIGPVLIGVVPMFIVLGFDVGCDLNFNSGGQFEMGFESTYSVEFGAKYNQFTPPEQWSPIWEVSKEMVGTPPLLDVGANLGAKLSVKPRLTVSIAGVDGPYLEAEPYLRVSANINLPNWNYGLYGGIDSRLGFAVGILGFDMADYSILPTNKEWTILEDSGINPTVHTSDIEYITRHSAQIGGSIANAGDTPVIDKGICWGLTTKPNVDNHVVALGSGTDAFSTIIQGLIENTTYYIRAYATNSSGTGWGEEKSFITGGSNDGTFTDPRDGHVYPYKAIGTQTWMTANMAYLPSVGPSSAGSETNPCYYVYGYEGSSVTAAKGNANYTTYGVLYNWPAALSACPSGWHLPTDAEWTILTNYLTNNRYGYGGSGSDIGKSLASTSGWTSYSTAGTIGNNQASNNSSGFSAVPGGFRRDSGGFSGIGTDAFFWSASGVDSCSWFRFLLYFIDGVGRGYDDRSFGFMARCLLD